MRGAILAGMASVALLASGCQYQPWPVHAAPAAKPASPLVAPADKALLVVALRKANGEGNGSTSVFDERKEPLAQFESTAIGWSTAELAPGKHSLYVRTWNNAFCTVSDVEMAPGKIYVLAVGNAGVEGIGAFASSGRAWIASPEEAGGILYFLPHVKLDVPAARALLQTEADDVTECQEASRSDEFSDLKPQIPLHPASAGMAKIEFGGPSPGASAAPASAPASEANAPAPASAPAP
jgi:hypothetical protein